MWMVTSWSRRIFGSRTSSRNTGTWRCTWESGRTGWSSGSPKAKATDSSAGGTSANMATVSRTREWRQKNIFENPSVTWEQGREMNPGACDPDARVELMDMEGIDKSILYPSLGLSWIGGTKDPALAAAYCRVYNDWLVNFCSGHPDRLYPAIALPWTDVNEAVKELKRTAGVGPRAVMCPATPPHDRSYGSRYWDSIVGGVPGARPTARVARERWRNSYGQSPAPRD